MTTADRLLALVAGSKWKHHDNDCTYEVIRFATDTTSNEPVVVYECVECPTAVKHKLGEWFTRPIGSFLGSVKVDGRYVRRFDHVGTT